MPRAILYLYSVLLYLILCNSILCSEKKHGKYIDIGDVLYPDTLKPTFKQCDCGRINTIERPNSEFRIINGTKLSYHRYPWLTLILHQNEFICGGSIISDLYILTAAHCMKNEFIKDDIKALIGEHNHCIPNSDTAVLSISDIIKHSQFNPRTFESDIMLLRVNMRITFNEFIRPICLPQHDFYQRFAVTKYRGRTGVIAGWGATDVKNMSSVSCTPKHVLVPILDREACAGYANTLFCAGYLDGRADSCQGDSGGPLQLKNKNNKFDLIGIISAGVGCAEVGKPGVYTDVPQNLNWIFKRITDSNCYNYSPPYLL